MTPEPFGYFRCDCDGWMDCAETDEGARPLYDQDTVDALVAQIEIERRLSFRNQVAELEQRLDGLAADAERLEWLIKVQCILINDFDGLVFPYWHTSGRRGEAKPTFREAIDAAIASAKEMK